MHIESISKLAIVDDKGVSEYKIHPQDTKTPNRFHPCCVRTQIPDAVLHALYNYITKEVMDRRTSADSDELETFNEDSLKEAIERTWGPAGAHMQIFNEMEKRIMLFHNFIRTNKRFLKKNRDELLTLDTQVLSVHGDMKREYLKGLIRIREEIADFEL